MVADWTTRLADRQEAGRLLARRLQAYAGDPQAVVLGLPRGGVVVAFEVARALDLPLDVFMVRKLGVPGQEELAAGAIASGGVRVLNDDVIGALGLSDGQIEAVTSRERLRLDERERLYRGHAQPLDVRGKTVILVDDGLATGASMRTAVRALRERHPGLIVVAVPVAPEDTCRTLRKEADDVVCPFTPAPFYSIGSWYHDFSQTSDEEVIALLEEARGWGAGAASDELTEREIEMPLDDIMLKGTLCLPAKTSALVLFVHGSGSSRFSSRNRAVARAINEAGIGTLLFDLLSDEEAEVDRYTSEFRFDIPLLTARVMGATRWLRSRPHMSEWRVGYFGASTGAAAALAAAARLGDVQAVVSRGGRPDLVLADLPQVKAPTLLVVGGDDSPVVDMNRKAYAALQTVKELRIIAGATHLFKEPGALEEVARLAVEWFARYLRSGNTRED